MKNKQLLLVLIISVVSVIPVLPYLMDSQMELIDFSQLPFSKGIFAMITTMQATVFIVLALFAGRWFAKKMDYQAFPKIKTKTITFAVIMGLSTGIILIVLDYFYHVNSIEPTFFSIGKPVIRKSLLACFYGGIVEEILMRFFLVSLFAFILVKIGGPLFKQRVLLAGMIATVIVALIFGISHLPVLQMMTDLNIIIKPE